MARYPNQPLLSAIVQNAQLKRSGLVADCVLPPVQVPSCEFSYIDWGQEYEFLKPENANVGCKTDVHEVDSAPFELIQGKVKDKALSQSLTECCVSLCGRTSIDVANMITMRKTLALQDKLFIAREIEVANIATDESAYSTITDPENESAEGALYEISSADFNDPNYALLKDFQDLQANNWRTGRRTKAVMSRNKLNALLRNGQFKEAGCLVPALATEAQVASLLGVDEICIADAGYNNGVTTVAMTGIWPDEYILLTASYELITTEDSIRAFGVSAYMKGFRQNNFLKEEKGPDEGVLMQKIAHDYTPVILDRNAATLIKITEE